MPSYTDFKAFYQDFEERLEFDFGTGSGWEDVTDYLERFNIIQDSQEGINGLTTRELELFLFVETSDPKWFKKNIKVRLYVSVSVDNRVSFFEEKIFEGVTKGQQAQMSVNISLDCIQKEDVEKLLVSNTIDADLFTWSQNVNIKGAYLSDSKVLEQIFGNTLITGTGIIWEETPAATTFNFRADSATAKNKNNFVFKGERKEAINQLLLALGVFGGFSIDGTFRVKKRVWNTPTTSETLDDDLIYENSFSSLNLSSQFNFNTLEVQGFGFEHLFRDELVDVATKASRFGLADWENNTDPTAIELEKMQRTINITNWVVPANGKSEKFLEFGDFVVSDIQNFQYINAKAFQTDDETNPVLDKVNIQKLAFTNNLLFDGVNDRVQIAHNAKFNLTSDMCIMGWIYPISAGNNFQMIATKTVGNGGANNTFEFRINPSGYLQFLFFDTALKSVTSAIPVTWSKWQHVAVTKDLFSNIINIYIDDVSVARVSMAFAGSTTNTSPVQIGGRDDLSSPFRGSMQDVRFYARVLGQNEIQELRNFEEEDTLTLFQNSLARYKLNEGTGTTATDSRNHPSYSPVNGTLTNFSGGFWQTDPAPIVKKTNTGIFFFTDFVNGKFVQRMKVTAENKNPFNVYIRQVNVSGRTIYQENKEISEEVTSVITGETKVKKEYRSYYINSSSYANTLATNLSSIYANLEFFEFQISYLPRLEVGDVVLFDTYLATNLKGVILRILTNYEKGSYGTSKILIKKI